MLHAIPSNLFSVESEAFTGYNDHCCTALISSFRPTVKSGIWGFYVVDGDGIHVDIADLPISSEPSSQGDSQF